MILIQFLVVIGCLLLGTRFAGMGLGLISGIGLFILSFVFGLAPGQPPVQVMLTILAVIGCAATLQTAGGLNVMMQFAERLLRRHPQYITILSPLTTWTLTFLCGTGHVVYTMFPIISDIALQKNIRPERPMAVASIASQMAICASPVSVAVVSMISILAAGFGIGEAYGLLDILMVAIPSSLTGVIIAALWSLRRGKELDDDEEFQAKIKQPLQRAAMYSAGETLLDTVFPKKSYWATWIFFAGIAAVVVLGAFAELRPEFTIKDKTSPLSMNFVIQMMMLVAGALILMRCKVEASEIANSAVFKAGMVAIFSVFGVAWMSDTFFQAHMPLLKENLSAVVQTQPWTYAVVLFLISKLVNSQAAAIAAIAPMGLALGVDPKMIIAFLPASYGYFILPTYPSDLACIGFDRSGTTRIGNYIINHSFLMPGLIGVSSACVMGYLLSQFLL